MEFKKFLLESSSPARQPYWKESKNIPVYPFTWMWKFSDIQKATLPFFHNSRQWINVYFIFNLFFIFLLFCLSPSSLNRSVFPSFYLSFSLTHSHALSLSFFMLCIFLCLYVFHLSLCIISERHGNCFELLCERIAQFSQTSNKCISPLHVFQWQSFVHDCFDIVCIECGFKWKCVLHLMQNMPVNNLQHLLDEDQKLDIALSL